MYRIYNLNLLYLRDQLGKIIFEMREECKAKF